MNLTSDALSLEWMSEVEKNKELLTVGDVIHGANSYYEITEINLEDDYFVCIDIETKEEDYFNFSELQMFWWIKEGAANYSQMVFRRDNGKGDARWMSYTEKKSRNDYISKPSDQWLNGEESEIKPVITVQKVTKTQVILEDGTVKDYKAYSRIGQKLTIVSGYAVLKDGKVAKSKRGPFEVYRQKKIATQVAESLKA